MKKMLSLLLSILLVSVVFAQQQPIVSTTQYCKDTERICYESCKSESNDIKTYIDQTKADVQRDTEGLGMYLLEQFKSEINSFVRKVILSFSISVLGIMLIIEGIIGYVRIKKEQDLLLSISERVNERVK